MGSIISKIHEEVNATERLEIFPSLLVLSFDNLTKFKNELFEYRCVDFEVAATKTVQIFGYNLKITEVNGKEICKVY